MEVNTAIISLARLRKLESDEKKLNEPRSKTIIVDVYGCSLFYKVETDDECIEKLANDLKEAREEINRLKEKINKRKNRWWN